MRTATAAGSVNADTTLYGSTQTALVLAELAAEHGDETVSLNETLNDVQTASRTLHTSPTAAETLTSDGFCVHSAEDEVYFKGRLHER